MLNAYYSEVLKYYQLGLLVSSLRSSEGPASPYLICFSSGTILGVWKIYIHKAVAIRSLFAYCTHFLHLNVLRGGWVLSCVSVLCPSILSDVPKDLPTLIYPFYDVSEEFTLLDML